MKNSKAGFLLIESLIVSTFISVTLIYVYTQFKVVYDSYTSSFYYNSVSNLYKMSNIKKFFGTSLDSSIFPVIDASKVVELTECPYEYTPNQDYCNSLFYNMDIAHIYIVNEDISAFKALAETSDSYDQDIINFLAYIKHGTIGYRIIVEFNDGTFASVNAF